LDASATLLSVAIGHVVSLSNEIDEVGVLAHHFEALYGIELCNLLVSLEAVGPRYGKGIASILAGKA
jgi:hypothetical protein